MLGEPCCEGERERRRQDPLKQKRDKVISNMAEVIYNNTDQSWEGAAVIAINTWDRIKDKVEVK